MRAARARDLGMPPIAQWPALAQHIHWAIRHQIHGHGWAAIARDPAIQNVSASAVRNAVIRLAHTLELDDKRGKRGSSGRLRASRPPVSHTIRTNQPKKPRLGRLRTVLESPLTC
jgi:hypothetical protein